MAESSKKMKEKRLEEKIKELEKELEETKGKVLGRDIVPFERHLLAKSEYEALMEFAKPYNLAYSVCSDRVNELGTFEFAYIPDGCHGSAMTLKIANHHIVEAMVYPSRLSRDYPPPENKILSFKGKLPKIKKFTVMTYGLNAGWSATVEVNSSVDY